MWGEVAAVVAAVLGLGGLLIRVAVKLTRTHDAVTVHLPRRIDEVESKVDKVEATVIDLRDTNQQEHNAVGAWIKALAEKGDERAQTLDSIKDKVNRMEGST